MNKARYPFMVYDLKYAFIDHGIPKKTLNDPTSNDSTRVVGVHSGFFAALLSEVSCENCTHTAIAAKKKGCYAQRDSGRVWTTPVMSGQG